MTFAEKIERLYERFAYVGKTGTNPHFKYKFVRESQLKRDLNQSMRELGLLLDDLTVQYTGDCKAGVCKVAITLTNSDNEEECLCLEGIGGGVDSSDKAPTKAMVAAFKYALLCGLSVETGEELDIEADGSVDDDAARALEAELRAAETPGALIELKPRVGTFQGGQAFNDLRKVYYEQMDKFENGGMRT